MFHPDFELMSKRCDYTFYEAGRESVSFGSKHSNIELLSDEAGREGI